MRRPRTQPNDHTQRAAAKLLGIAPTITQLVEQHRQALQSIGWPTTRLGPKISGGGGSHHSTAEHDAIQLTQITAQRDDLKETIIAVTQHVDALIRLVHHQLGHQIPAADGHALCCDLQHGRQGHTDWGDPTCTELPVTGGLCYRCYQSERRWRAANGLTDRAQPADLSDNA